MADEKPKAPKPPSAEVIELVLNSAYSAPQANCKTAQDTLAALVQVDNYFKALAAG